MLASFGFAFDNPDFAEREVLIEVDDAGDESSQEKKKKKSEDDESDESSHTSDPKSLQHRKVYCSAVVLARASPFFRTLLSKGNPMREGGQAEVRLVVETSAQADALYVALKSLHFERLTGEDDESGVSPLELLLVADRFAIPSVAQLAVEALDEGLADVATACAVLELPAAIQCPECRNSLMPVVGSASALVLGEFGDVAARWQSDAWLRLTPPALLCILQSSAIVAPSENTIYCAARRWVSFSLAAHARSDEDREVLLRHVVGCIRFGMLRRHYLLFVVKHDRLFLDAGKATSGEFLRAIDRAIVFQFCTGAVRRNIFGADTRHEWTPRLSFHPEPAAEIAFEFQLSAANFPQNGACVESDRLFVDGNWFYVQAMRMRGREPGHEPTLALFAFWDKKKSMFLEGDLRAEGAIGARYRLQVLNRITQQWSPTQLPCSGDYATFGTDNDRSDGDDDGCLEDARAWSELVWCENDHHSEDNTGWGYYDALHMGANGWAAAVDSAYGIVENPFIGVSGSVRVKLRVCLHPEDGPMA